jgi:hypothetical protein
VSFLLAPADIARKNAASASRVAAAFTYGAQEIPC